MKNISIFLFTLLISITSFSQLKKITLEESVLQQGRKFGADKMLGFQWIPNSNNYIYCSEKWTKLLIANPSDNKPKEVVSLSDLNKNLGTDFKNFFGIEFKDSNIFTITNGLKYYEYNLATKSGKLTQELSDTFENATFDPSKVSDNS